MMASPQAAAPALQEDVEMQDPPEDNAADAVGEDEDATGSGDENGEPTANEVDADSSEEGEDDEEGLLEIQQGFINDEDEDEDAETDEEERRRRRRKKKKRKRVKDHEEDDLDEEDLELMEENTGVRSRRLTRVRRGRASSTPPPEVTSRKRVRETQSEDDSDAGGDLGHIWDDNREGMDADEMDDDFDFIEYDDDQEGEMNEEERHERRRAEKQRRRAMGIRPEMAGIDPAAWDEIFDVFGDGREYEWALDGEDGEELEEQKGDMKYHDVFEPSEIKARHLTEDDDIIRMTDIPERMQLSTSSLSTNATLALHEDFDLTDYVQEAAEWVALRISPRIARDFFRPGAPQSNLLQELVMAVTASLELMLIKNFEVPYIHTHRRDIISHFDYENTRTRTELLSRDELWRVQTLGMKFRALMERKQVLLKTYERLAVHDQYFEMNVVGKLSSIEAVADATEWLGLKHRQAQKDAQELAADEGEARKFKKPSRTSAYEVARGTVTSKLADDFGLPSHEIVMNHIGPTRLYTTIDQDIKPLPYAEQFVNDSSQLGRTPEEQLSLARMIIATELGRDPLLRTEMRKMYEKRGVVSVTPTEKGINKIDEFHPFHNFAYLKEKPVEKMLETSQFLQILQAEREHMVILEIKLLDIDRMEFEDRLAEAFMSDGFTEAAKEWNQQRREVAKEAMEKYLLPSGAKWTREWLREEVEDMLAKKCGDALQDKLNQAPFKSPGIDLGEVPTVLAVSWGKGDPQKDPIHAVFLDETGRLREHLKMDNLVDVDLREAFLELIKRRRPDIIVVGGFTIFTKRLMDMIKELLGMSEAPTDGQPSSSNPAHNGMNGASASQSGGGGGGWGNQGNSASAGGWGSSQPADAGGWGDSSQATGGWGSTSDANAGGWGSGANAGGASASGGWGDSNQSTAGSPSKEKGKDKDSDKERTIPVIYINDEVARVYQHSGRADEEFGRLPLTGRYCIGLARYAQSPLNEYAALGSDLAAMTFDETQHLVPKEKLLVAIERALVNIVNTVGVDINRAVTDPYYQSLLPFVAGLGPRKAAALVNRISSLGGTLSNRTQLVAENVLSLHVFLNAAGFLRIPQESDYKRVKKNKKKNANRDNVDELPDPLDDTRIHPEDYDLARKMAMDALEIDEEDVEEGHPSQNVVALMADPDAATKLNLLNLDEFAVQLRKTTDERKRHTLNVIRDEIIKPFGEQRKEFQLPDQWDIVTMITGETPETLKRGRIISVSVLRIKSTFVVVKLDSGMEGIINVQYLTNSGDVPVDKVVQKGQNIPGVIIETYVENFRVELSARPMDVEAGDADYRRIPTDEFYDQAASLKSKDLQDRKRRREVDRARRVIKHPNFRNMTFLQAEEYLATQQRGDVVIRPSTKGPDHLAVTWKVDDGVFQHIDVVDPNADLNSTNVGSKLIVEGGKYHFSDLDELIVNHVKAMARKVEELMAHEKFQKGDESEISVFLDNAVKAQAQRQARSVYAFGLDRKRAGWFLLMFKTNMMSPTQSLPVKVTPRGYVLGKTERGSVADLCDTFKTVITQNKLGDSNRTPYHAAGGKTPAQTPGGRMTPAGHLSSRHTPGHATSRTNPNNATGKTPNPYATGKTPNPYGNNHPPRPPSNYGSGWGGQPQADSAPGGWGSTPNTGAGGWAGATPAQDASAGGWGQAPTAGGWGAPPPPPPPPRNIPPGMNPQRAAMLQASNNSGGGGGGGGGGGNESGGWGGSRGGR